jgi:hypothetical protein
MSLAAGISVRFDAQTRATLDALAAKSGLSVADLIRRATIGCTRRWEQEGRIELSLLQDAPGLPPFQEPKPLNYRRK